MIDALRVNAVREVLKSLMLKILSNYLWLKASVSLIFCLKIIFNHSLHCFALILMGSY
jgi:hypothetical protein